jgi:hypothetical protein
VDTQQSVVVAAEHADMRMAARPSRTDVQRMRQSKRGVQRTRSSIKMMPTELLPFDVLLQRHYLIVQYGRVSQRGSLYRTDPASCHQTMLPSLHRDVYRLFLIPFDVWKRADKRTLADDGLRTD